MTDYIIDDNVNRFTITIIDAVKYRQLDLIKTLLINGFRYSLDYDCDPNTDALAMALTRDYPEGVKAIILYSKNFDVNYDFERATILHWAIRHRYYDIANLLIMKGAVKTFKCFVRLGPNKNEIYMTPLEFAIDRNDYKMVKLLLENGTPTRQYNTGSPLIIAMNTYNININIVNMLIEYGADITEKDIHGADVSIKDKYGRTILGWASQNAFCHTVDLLIEHGANINEVDDNNKLPIYYAILFGNVNIVKLYINKYNVNVDTYVDKYDTLLNYSIKNPSNRSITEFLIKSGADTKKKDYSGSYPLNVAISNCDVKLVKLLLEHGGYYDFKDNWHSPINHAIEGSTCDVIEVLLNYIGDINNLPYDNSHPLVLATYNNYKDIAELLLKYKNGHITEGLQKALNESVCIAIDKNNYSIAMILLSNGCDVNTLDKGGHTLLYRALMSYRRNTEFIKCLLRHGANPNHENCFLTACFYSTLEVVELMLNKGADINAKCKYSGNALHALLDTKHDSKLRYELVKRLIKAGIDLNVKNNKGETPLHLAARHPNPKYVKLLTDTLYYK